MTLRIHKAQVELEEYQAFQVQGEVRNLLDVQLQGGEYQLWYEVNPDIDVRSLIQLGITGTGHNVDRRLDYITTTQQPPFVWHWYGKAHTE